MKKTVGFLLKAALVFCLVVGFVFGIVMPQYRYNYNASLIDKEARLKSLDEPKIVLVGDSNVAFGFNSQMLEEAMGMPVVNMGLHGGLGNAFLEQAAIQNVTAGDLYIICHTDFNDNDEIVREDPTLAWLTLENHFDLWKLMRRKDIPTMAGSFTSYLKKALNLWLTGTGNQDTGDAYSRTAFNAYGDDAYPRPYVEHNEFFPHPVDFTQQTVPEIGEATVNRLNELHRYLKSKGATMLIAAYPIAYGEYTPLMSDYQAFEDELIEKLDCPVISSYSDYMYDYDFFYDTVYHLVDDGVEMRTSQLISDLEWYYEVKDEMWPEE